MNTLLNYHLFAGSDYYPAGGYDDYIGSFETLKIAQDYIKENCNEISCNPWAHVVFDHKIIWEGHTKSIIDCNYRYSPKDWIDHPLT